MLIKGVEIIPQTMAPFPWHFAGQRYQNIFILKMKLHIIVKNDAFGVEMNYKSISFQWVDTLTVKKELS